MPVILIAVSHPRRLVIMHWKRHFYRVNFEAGTLKPSLPLVFSAIYRH